MDIQEDGFKQDGNQIGQLSDKIGSAPLHTDVGPHPQETSHHSSDTNANNHLPSSTTAIPLHSNMKNGDGLNKTYEESEKRDQNRSTSDATFDKEALLRQLRVENERILAEQLKKLNDDFQAQLRNAIAPLTEAVAAVNVNRNQTVRTSLSGSQSTAILTKKDLLALKGRRAKSQDVIDSENQRMQVVSTRTTPTEASIHVYTGQSHAAKLRPLIESAEMVQNLTVSTATGQNVSNSSINRAKKKKNGMKKDDGHTGAAPHLVARYLSAAPTSSQAPVNTNTKKQRTKVEPSPFSDSMKSFPDPVVGEDMKEETESVDTATMDKFHWTTRHMLKKSEYLLNQSQEVSKPKRSKKKKRMANQSASHEYYDRGHLQQHANEQKFENSLAGGGGGGRNEDNYEDNEWEGGNDAFVEEDVEDVEEVEDDNMKENQNQTYATTFPAISNENYQVLRHGQQIYRNGKTQDPPPNDDDSESSLNDLKLYQKMLEAKEIRRQQMLNANKIPSPRKPMSPPKPQLPPEWAAKRVDAIEEDKISSVHSNAEWENQLARQILSVFASQTLAKDARSSTVVLEYVDNTRKETTETVTDYALSIDNSKQKGIFTDFSYDKTGASAGNNVDDRNGDLTALDVADFEENTAYGGQERMEVKESAFTVRPSTTSNLSHTRPRGNSRGKTAPSPNSKQKDDIKRLHRLPGYEDFEKSFSRFRSCNLFITKEKEEVALRGSPKVFPIWYVSTADVYMDWSMLPGGTDIQSHLKVMYEHRQFKEYLRVIELVLDDLLRKVQAREDGTASPGPPSPLSADALKKARIKRAQGDDREMGPAMWPRTTTIKNEEGKEEIVLVDDEDEQERKKMLAKKKTYSREEVRELWRRLVVVSNAIAITSIERGNPDIAMEIITKSDSWALRGDIFPTLLRRELRAMVYDTLAFYFYKKKKFSSAMINSKKALEIHEELMDRESVAVSLSHIAVCQFLLGDFKATHKTLYQFLAMVEEGRLRFSEATPQQLCVVAIAYHNLAVTQMKLLVPDLAIKNSQCARKLARLCLAHSNRWLNQFQYTHEACIEDINFQLAIRNNMTPGQFAFLKEMAEDAFSTNDLKASPQKPILSAIKI